MRLGVRVLSRNTVVLGKSRAVYENISLACGLLLSASALAQDCPISPLVPLPKDRVADDALVMSAGKADIDAYAVSTLSGGVRLRFADQTLMTDHLRYDYRTRLAETNSPVQFRNAQSQIEAGSVHIDLENDVATFRDTSFIFSNGGRGGAAKLRLAPNSLNLQRVEYTTCAPDDAAWAIHGSRIDINSERGEGIARNMQLRFFDVPVLYLPWFRFPVTEDRQTGLLYPQMGSRDSTGFYMQWPVYLNLHPQADLTLTPEWLSRRGSVLGAHARGLWHSGRAEVKTRWLTRDQITNRKRYQWGAQLRTSLFTHTRADLQYEEVSDIEFLRDIGLEDRDSSTNALERRLDVSWRPMRDLNLRSRILDYQILDPLAPDDVYAREPEISALFSPLRNWHGWRPLASVEYVRFAGDQLVTTSRFDAFAQLGWEHRARGWEASLSGGWRTTRYKTDKESTVARDLPSVRASIRLNFLRNARAGLVQTLTPRLDYLYTPYRDQNALPILDTSLPDFSLDQLRSNNRFTSIDRISDENTLIPSVESNVLDPISGIRRARFRFGLQYRLDESRITLPNEPGRRQGASDWLIESDVNAANGIRGRAAAQYNTEESQFDALNVGGRFIGQGGERMQLAYRFRRNLFEQIDALALWPLSRGWHGAARWVWALDENRSQETLAGISYQSCCWGMTVGARRFANGAANDFDTGVFFQLVFRGLGNFGSGFGDIFDRNSLSF